MSIMTSGGSEASFGRSVVPESEEELFFNSLVASRPHVRMRWQRVGAPASFAVHLLVEDGKHGRLLPGQRHRLLDGVLKQLAHLSAAGGGSNAL